MSNEYIELAMDFEKSSAATASAIFDAFKSVGEDFAEEWRANARETSGAHGKHYPNSITSETRVGMHVEVLVGPESNRPQGRMGMGFEYGSMNQPPHLDGLRASVTAQELLRRRVDSAIGLALP